MNDDDHSEGANRDDTTTDPIKDRIDNAEPVSPAENGLTVIKGGRDSQSPSPDDVPPHDGEGVEWDKAEHINHDDLTDEQLLLVRECAQLDQNDRDNARRVIIWFGCDLAYVAGMGWLTWRGTHWLRDEGELQARLHAQNVVDRIKLEPIMIEPAPGQERLLLAAKALRDKEQSALTQADMDLVQGAKNIKEQLSKKRSSRRSFAVTSGNAGRTSAMLLQAASLQSVDQDDLDANAQAFNLMNGTLKFSWVRDEECPDPEAIRWAGKIDFDAHNRADMITRRAEVEYDVEAKCPVWDEFLQRVQPNDEMRRFLQVFHAYALLIGGNDEQKLIFHYGGGANGKSVFIETLGRLAGKYRSVVSPDTITGDTNRAGQQASPDIARLFNTRMVTIEELPRGSPLKESLIKAVSGGTKMTARFLQKEIFEFEPMFTAVLTGNDMPEISGTDFGIWRRVLLMEWAVTIPDSEQVAFGEMLKRFDAERSGILNWLLEGLRLYMSHGLKEFIPSAVTEFTEDYREDRDPVGQFAEACVVRTTDGSKVQGKDMFKAYQDWSEENALKAWQQTNFGRRMSALKFKKKKGRVVEYIDVRLEGVPDRFDNLPPKHPDDPGPAPNF